MSLERIDIHLASNPKHHPEDESTLGFGRFFTDHMFIVDYSEERRWHTPRIIPHGPIMLDPGAAALHYGQSVFEGMKAYKSPDGRVLLFRPRNNIERMNISNERVCMPQLEIDFTLRALKTLVRLDQSWIPTSVGTALYIRPLTFATEAFLGVRPSKNYQFLILLSPVGPYYPQGLKPVCIYVEQEFVRSVRGGVGSAKVAGNYAAGLKAQAKAAQYGCVQVLWLDALERKYVEEVGAMNVFFKIRGKVVTPPLEGTILPGVTRDSVITLLRHWGMAVEERKISIDEIYAAHLRGELDEVFGTGTAAVISPVGKLVYDNRDMIINGGRIAPVTQKLFDALTGIQRGITPDPFGWTEEIPLEEEHHPEHNNASKMAMSMI